MIQEYNYTNFMENSQSNTKMPKPFLSIDKPAGRRAVTSFTRNGRLGYRTIEELKKGCDSRPR